MRNVCLLSVAAVAIALSLAGAAPAPKAKKPAKAPAAARPAGTPLEQARALVAQKKYDEVDEVLEKELAQKAPNAEALRLSLDAAVASGRIVTAANRATSLLKATDNKDPALVYQGARVAETVGDSRMALVRYLAYARMVEQKTPELEHALRYVLKRETYPDEYKKFVRLFGADDVAWGYGTSLLGKLIEVADAERVLDTAEFLAANFPQPERISHVHASLRGAADGFVFGREPKDRYLPPLRAMLKSVPGDFGHLDHVFNAAEAALTEEQRYHLLVEYQAFAKVALSANLVQRFAHMRALPTDDAKLAAGRAYLALEPLYLNHKDPSRYDYYLRVIGDGGAVFNVKDKALVSGAEFAQKFEHVKAKYPGDEVRNQTHHISYVEGYYGPDTPNRVAFLQKHLTILNPGQVGSLLQLTNSQNASAVIGQAVAGKAYRDALDYRIQLAGYLNANKEEDALLAPFREYMGAYPANFNGGYVVPQLVGSPLMEPPEKLAFLQEHVARAGYSPAMKAVLDQMAADQANWGSKPEFQQLKAAFDAKPAGSDPAMAASVALANAPANNAAPDANTVKVATDFLASYQGAIPGGVERAKDAQELLVQQVFDQHAAHVWGNADAVIAFGEMWGKRLPPGSNWNRVVQRVNEFQRYADQAKMLPLYAAATAAAGEKGDPAVWWSFTTIPAGKNPPTVPLSGYYDRFRSTDDASGYVFNLRHGQSPPPPKVLVDELAKVAAVPGAKFESGELAGQWLAHIGQWVNAETKVSLPLVKTLWDTYAAGLQAGTVRPNPYYETMTYAAYARSGPEAAAQAAAQLDTNLKLIDARPVDQQLEAYNHIWQWVGLPTEERAEAGKTAELQPGKRRHTLLKRAGPVLAEVLKLPPRRFESMRLHGQMMADLHGYLGLNAEQLAKDPALAAQHKDAVAVASAIEKFVAAGARFEGQLSWFMPVLDIEIRAAVDAGNWPEVNRLLNVYGAALAGEPQNWEQHYYQQRVVPLVQLLEEHVATEVAYAFMMAVERAAAAVPGANVPEAMAKQVLLLKGKAAARIAGLIPVPADDPAYDLYRAAHALGLGDEARAWELTQPKLKLLTESWENYEPGFVAWTVDQVRKQKMLKDALDYAFKVLLQENNLDPETAAAVSLVKGDVYRDMENYQAARIEYEALKNNAKYARTDAGGQAVYRLIDLHITTKDYVPAEQLLERLVDADNLRTQAEANYLYARMAYQQAEYKEAKEYLKKVRDRVLNHVGAALLEGELNLLLPGGLQNTEVAIGDPRLSTIVIPGRPLELKLQDQNLSVARGGAAIPVVIRTSKGGDVEKAELLPSPNNKNLFAGKITTALGKAEKGNLTLELLGDDVVSYEIDPEFQKANDISYPAKRLEIRYDARLAASSGEILSAEEEERRELERQLQQRQTLQSRRLEMSRDGRTVRPGSPIYVQVTDLDRNLTDEADTVRVDLQTASGDVLEGFELAETGQHTGVFRGAVPTGIPLPKAAASDTEEGGSPAGVIRTGAGNKPWTSLADGKKPKWVEVDTMSSHEVASVSVEVPNAAAIREASLSGLLSDDYEDLAFFPDRADASRGGLVLEVAPDANGNDPLQLRRHLKLGGTATPGHANPHFDRADTAQKAGDGWQTARVRGTFYVPANTTLELKFLQPVSPSNWQTAWVLIDGEQVLGLQVNEQTIPTTGKVDLVKGAHTYEMVVRDHWKEAKVIVGYRKPDGTFAPLPEEWFSLEKNPALKTALQPRGKITVDAAANTLTATLDKPTRLRRVRFNFDDFAGTSVTVKSVSVKTDDGKTIVPGAADFASGLKDKVLQIAPGDQVTVTYSDALRLREEGGQAVTAALNSSYFNGRVMLAEEVITANPNNPQERWTHFLEAKRCRPGDQLMIVVTDYDEDTTDERDTVTVKVTTSSGEKLTLKALETWTNYAWEEANHHAGEYLAVLKLGDATGKDTIKVAPGDKITVSYVDKENTNPGVPVNRAYALFEAGKAAPRTLVYRTAVQMVEDTSPEALTKLKRISGREIKGAGGAPLKLYKPQIIARHPDYVAPVASADKSAAAGAAASAKGKPVVASVAAPLLFEVTYPKFALNSGSVLEVTAVAESELNAAKKGGREPVAVKVPTYVEGLERLAQIKGYAVQLQSHQRRDAREMLRDGSFSGVVRLQVGSPGDPLDDLVVGGVQEFATEAERNADKQGFYYRVPTLLVSGSDTVHLRVKDVDSGKVVQTQVRLLSDARLELLDRTYTVETAEIHLGDKFYLRVTDPDHDAGDDRDTVDVTVKAKSGDTLKVALTETLPHSGIFTANVEPKFVGEKGADGKSPQADPKDEVLSVAFGDEVTFTYSDATSLESLAAVAVSKKAKVLHGADGRLAAFTKRFKDPEIAVKTRFLMAESLFEMAKERRKLGQKAVADEEIARGKRILEEAIRDYPDTSLAVQGEYLLANLAQELNNHQEAVGRYSNVISTWPDSEYAAPSQFKKALCFEKLQNYDQACEEYVKLTYIYPENPLVADATVRLGNYYYKKQSYKIAGKIFYNFREKNPAHKLAAEALFLAAQCEYKQADFREAGKRFGKVVAEYPDEKEVRSEAMYWLADSTFKAGEAVKAYQTFKKLTWDYPDSKWAKTARGRLTEEVFSKMAEDEQ